MSIDLNTLGGHEFEDLTEQLLVKMGFATEGRKPSADGGIDMVAVSNQAFVGGRYIVQCKRYNHPVSSPIIRDLYGVVMAERANKGILITNSTFTTDAVEFARDKPIELIDGSTLVGLLEKYTLLPTTGAGLTPVQTASLMLRNEITGLADKFLGQLNEIDSSLVLTKRNFGNEYQMSTYKAFEEWTHETQSKMTAEIQAIKTVTQELVEFRSSTPPDPARARRLRAQQEELFGHMLTLYDDVRRTQMPAVAANYQRALTAMIRAGLVHYAQYVKGLEDTLTAGGNISPYNPSTEGSEEVRRTIQETQEGILRVFHGRGHGHHLLKLQGGQFKCSCGLFLPNREEAVAHVSTKHLGR